MSKLFVLVIILPLIFIGCSQSKEQDSDKNDNVLLAKEVLVSSLSLIDNQNNPKWTASFNKKAFFDTLFNRAKANKFHVYGDVPADFEDIELQNIIPVDDIPLHLKMTGNNGEIKSINEILFYEKWNFNRKKLKFLKEILGWCPVKNWKHDNKELRQKTFYIYPEFQTKGKEITESIFYEIPWFFDISTTITGFDKKAFLKFIIESIISGKISAYDPIYLVDKSKRKFTHSELQKYIGQDLKPGIINFGLSSLLFEEDWYFDQNTLSIQKDVKSFAFVQENYDSVSGESSKKILFFIFPKE
jgi:hypothetical protein